MNNELNKYIEDITTQLENLDILLTNSKEIPYGRQLKFQRDQYQINLNIYFSKKRGISTVINSKTGNPLKPELEMLLNKLQQKADIQTSISHNWQNWIGTDESGKGDFFGPLVVCAFYCDNRNISYLRQLGVDDSKKIKDKDIIHIAEKILKYFNNQVEVVILNPEKYNEVYEKFRQQNKKLNELLGWMHGRCISNLLNKFDPQGIIVDKFSKKDVVSSSLKELKNINISQFEKAESDIAVATASIIARYYFITKMDILSNKFHFDFPKGASSLVKKKAVQFSQKNNFDKLSKVCKTHFKTYKEVYALVNS